MVTSQGHCNTEQQPQLSAGDSYRSGRAGNPLKVDRPAYPSICSQVLRNNNHKYVSDKVSRTGNNEDTRLTLHDVIKTESRDSGARIDAFNGIQKDTATSERVIFSTTISRQKKQDHPNSAQNNHVTIRENSVSKDVLHQDLHQRHNKQPLVSLPNCQSSQIASSNKLFNDRNAFGQAHHRKEDEKGPRVSSYPSSSSSKIDALYYNRYLSQLSVSSSVTVISVNSPVQEPRAIKTTVQTINGGNTVSTQFYQNSRVYPSPCVPDGPNTSQLPKPSLINFTGHSSSVITGPMQSLLIATPTPVKPSVNEHHRFGQNSLQTHTPTPIRPDPLEHNLFVTPAKEDQRRLESPMCPTARRTWARTPHAKEKSRSAVDESNTTADDSTLSLLIPAREKDIAKKTSTQLSEDSKKCDNNINVPSSSVMEIPSSSKIGHFGQTSAFRRVAATCNVLPRNTIWTSVPKSTISIQKPNSDETSNDALLDAEVTVYSRLLEISKSMGKVGVERKDCVDPVAKILTEGDSLVSIVTYH